MPICRRKATQLRVALAKPSYRQGYKASRGFANNKGTNKPTHPHSLTSTFVIRLGVFVIRLLESIVSKRATSEIQCIS